MSDLSITAREHVLQAYLQTPADAGPWPGVVVLHDVLGLTDDTRRYVDWFAAAGFLAIAPDLYSWGNKLLCVRALFRDLFAQNGASFADIDAARSTLAGREDCTGRVGVIGFCMGGGFALLAAANRGFAASSVNYGLVPQNASDVLRGACPIVGSFGARDYLLKTAAPRLEAAVQKAAVAYDVKEYPEAGHAFMNVKDGLAGWIMPRIGMTFHEPATRDAQRRILAFFHRYLD